MAQELRVVIAGGGVAALEATLALRALAEERVSIRLIAPDPHFWYRPLSVLEPFGTARVEPLELAEIAQLYGAEFDLGALASVDAQAHVARTAAGAEYEYDALVIASGARLRDALAGAFTFRGPGDSVAVAGILADLESTAGARLVFAVPAGATWPIPLYELALLTAAHLANKGITGIEIAIVTPEAAPLALFGSAASAEVARLLRERSIAVHAGRVPLTVDAGTLTFSPSGSIPADRVIALPRIEGRPIPGIPYDEGGFVKVDASGRVVGLEDVYAAGDATAFPVKHGGLAAQQADAVAEAIAFQAGAPITPNPFRPVLQGMLYTGGATEYLRAEIADGAAESSRFATEPLWWPPGKIVGRYLAPFLAERASLGVAPASGVHGALPVQVEF